MAVHGGPPFSLMDVDLYVDSELVTTYSCDGLILSTPVGSTAHSLAAGGPILRKDLQAMVIMPISPHTLTNRPVVDSADRLYEMVVARPDPETSVVVDGRVLCRLQPGDRVCVERAAPQFKLVTAPGHSLLSHAAGKTGLERTTETQRRVTKSYARVASGLARRGCSERTAFDSKGSEQDGYSVCSTVDDSGVDLPRVGRRQYGPGQARRQRWRGKVHPPLQVPAGPDAPLEGRASLPSAHHRRHDHTDRRYDQHLGDDLAGRQGAA